MGFKMIRDLLNYDPDTGVITWKVRAANCIHVGDIAGTPSKDGYLQIQVRGKDYPAHRLAWFLHYREWPPEQLDHINEIKNDNRIANLRLASNSENSCNRGKQNNNTSGYKGATLHKASGRWHARCQINGKRIYLGLYDTPEEAHAAYCAFAKENHKEFFHP